MADTAALFTTQPLPLGLLLYVENYTLTAEAFDVPITPQDVSLLATQNTADLGTSHPLALGLVLGTGGTTNYLMTAEAFALPITMQDVALTPKSPAGVQTTFPLALGILLDAQSFVLTAEAFDVPISFAPGEALSVETTAETTDTSGGWAEVALPKRKTRNPVEEALDQAKTAIATAAALNLDELEARLNADTERIRQRRAKRAEERRSQEVASEIKRLLDERLGLETAIAQAESDDETAAIALILALA